MLGVCHKSEFSEPWAENALNSWGFFSANQNHYRRLSEDFEVNPLTMITKCYYFIFSKLRLFLGYPDLYFTFSKGNVPTVVLRKEK